MWGVEFDTGDSDGGPLFTLVVWSQLTVREHICAVVHSPEIAQLWAGIYCTASAGESQSHRPCFSMSPGSGDIKQTWQQPWDPGGAQALH